MPFDFSKFPDIELAGYIRNQSRRLQETQAAILDAQRELNARIDKHEQAAKSISQYEPVSDGSSNVE